MRRNFNKAKNSLTFILVVWVILCEDVGLTKSAGLILIILKRKNNSLFGSTINKKNCTV